MQRDTLVFDIINQELARQRRGIELIASENFTSLQVMQAMGGVMTNKYAEGYPCLLYTSPSPRDRTRSRMPSSA